MASLRTQNALLFVIALCLVLIVVHLYSGHLVTQAQAQTEPKDPPTKAESPLDPKGVHLYAKRCDFKDATGRTCQWEPVSLTVDGILLTSK